MKLDLSVTFNPKGLEEMSERAALLVKFREEFASWAAGPLWGEKVELWEVSTSRENLAHPDESIAPRGAQCGVWCPKKQWVCTRGRGHGGVHVAHGSGEDDVLLRWKQEELGEEEPFGVTTVAPEPPTAYPVGAGLTSPLEPAPAHLTQTPPQGWLWPTGSDVDGKPTYAYDRREPYNVGTGVGCGERSPLTLWYCTREVGHTGAHVAHRDMRHDDTYTYDFITLDRWGLDGNHLTRKVGTADDLGAFHATTTYCAQHHNGNVWICSLPTGHEGNHITHVTETYEGRTYLLILDEWVR